MTILTRFGGIISLLCPPTRIPLTPCKHRLNFAAPLRFVCKQFALWICKAHQVKTRQCAPSRFGSNIKAYWSPSSYPHALQQYSEVWTDVRSTAYEAGLTSPYEPDILGTTYEVQSWSCKSTIPSLDIFGYGWDTRLERFPELQILWYLTAGHKGDTLPICIVMYCYPIA